jgi:hypothetical protein
MTRFHHFHESMTVTVKNRTKTPLVVLERLKEPTERKDGGGLIREPRDEQKNSYGHSPDDSQCDCRGGLW